MRMSSAARARASAGKVWCERGDQTAASRRREATCTRHKRLLVRRDSSRARASRARAVSEWWWEGRARGGGMEALHEYTSSRRQPRLLSLEVGGLDRDVARLALLVGRDSLSSRRRLREQSPTATPVERDAICRSERWRVWHSPLTAALGLGRSSRRRTQRPFSSSNPTTTPTSPLSAARVRPCTSTRSYSERVSPIARARSSGEGEPAWSLAPVRVVTRYVGVWTHARGR